MRRWITAVLVAGSLGAGSLAPSGPALAADAGLFHPYVDSDPVSAAGVAIGDVTGDGRADVLLSTDFDADPDHAFGLWVYPQGAGGSLGAPVRVDSPAPYGSTMAVALADLDQDGDLDAALSTDTGVRLYQQGPDGLAYEWTVPVTDALDILLVDVTGDGLADLVANSRHGVEIWKQVQGDLTRVLAPGLLTDLPATEVEVGDVTGDSRVDVVTAQRGTIQVFAQTADGSFGSPASYASGGTNGSTSVNGLAIGDTDGDGLADVHASVGGNKPDSWVVTRRQQADGTLGAPVLRASYDLPETLEYADVTGDGRGDLVVLHGGWNALGVYDSTPGTAPYETRYAVPYASHYDAAGLAVGDVSGDGKADVAVADYNHGLVLLRGARPGDDVTAPETTITDGPPSTSRSRSATFAFTATEPGTFQCSLDRSSWAACASGTTYDGLAAGSHTFRVRATDAALNTDTSYAQRSFTVDGPETTITAGPTGSVRATSATFSFTASPAAARFECSFDGPGWSPCTSPVTYTGLAPGTGHVFDVRGVSADGLADLTPASRSFAVETATDLGVTLGGTPDPVKKGGASSWTAQVRNAGSTTASAVRLSQSLPSGVAFVSVASSDARATCAASGSSVRCELADLPGAATWTLTVRTTVTVAKGTLTSTAQVATTTWDDRSDNDSASATVRVGGGK